MFSDASLIIPSTRSTPCSPGSGQNSACQVAAPDQKPRPTADAHSPTRRSGRPNEATMCLLSSGAAVPPYRGRPLPKRTAGPTTVRAAGAVAPIHPEVRPPGSAPGAYPPPPAARAPARRRGAAGISGRGRGDHAPWPPVPSPAPYLPPSIPGRGRGDHAPLAARAVARPPVGTVRACIPSFRELSIMDSMPTIRA